MISYRIMTIEDYDGVYELWAATPEMGINSTDDSREGIGRYICRNPNTSFVALSEGKVVGCILAGHDGRRGTIQHMTVHADYRKQGIGSELVRLCLEALHREGIPKVNLLAFTKNAPANAFWERMGFPARNDLVYRDRELQRMEYRPNAFREKSVN